MSNLNVDIVPVADEAGRMQVLPMRGWFAGLQYNFSKRVFASTSYSQSRLFTKDCYAHFNETQYKKRTISGGKRILECDSQFSSGGGVFAWMA